MNHFTVEQRYKLDVLLQQNVCKKQIAIQLEKHISSIYREISRNSDERNMLYRADLASRKCRKRHSEKSKNQCFSLDKKHQVCELIREDLSPEQIVGKLKKESVFCVSHETIYKLIWEDKKNGGDLYKHLRNRGKAYRKRGASKDKRGQITGRIGIENRPKEVEENSDLET